MRTLSNREATIVIGLLVEKLGGEAILTREDVARADDLGVESIYSPATMQTRITARRPPVTVPGEIVTAEPQSIEPLHDCDPEHAFEQYDGTKRCACGAYV